MDVDARAAKRKAPGDAASAAPALCDSSRWGKVQAWLAFVLDARDCEDQVGCCDPDLACVCHRSNVSHCAGLHVRYATVNMTCMQRKRLSILRVESSA